ncbi:MAG: hypothetical protein LBG82_06580 [Clostridiales Family XIII bacterium]|jgi:hypothetical protein|nr:hypothetical protein [Clostridiales Family XIII bacterium]
MSIKNAICSAASAACLIAALIAGGTPRLVLVLAAAVASFAGLAFAIAGRRKAKDHE